MERHKNFKDLTSKLMEGRTFKDFFKDMYIGAYALLLVIVWGFGAILYFIVFMIFATFTAIYNKFEAWMVKKK